MRIEIWLDFNSPYCYLGKRQLDLALRKFLHRDYVRIQFKGYQQVADLSAYQHIQSEATKLGLTIRLKHLPHIETFDIHRLVKHASYMNKDEIFVEEVFKAYFTKGKNINDQKILEEIAQTCNIDKTSVQQILETKKFTNIVQEEIELAYEIGVDTIPFFVFNEKHALSGIQSVEIFQEVLEVLWREEGEQSTSSQFQQTTYCCGSNCDHSEKEIK